MTEAQDAQAELTPEELAELMEMDKKATERASRYAPLPKYDIPAAGAAGGVATAIAIIMFTGFAGLDLEQFPTSAGSAMLIGFAIPALYIWQQKRKHYNAWSKEYEALRSAANAKVDTNG